MSEIGHVTGKQIAAARTLLGMAQGELAKLANISAPTLRRIETDSDDVKPMKNNLRAVIGVLHDRGVTFLADGQAAVGEGVSLRDKMNG